MSTAFGKGTLCIQAGYSPGVGEPRILPIVQSTTYKYDDIEHVRRVMTLQEFGFKYSRTGNPTVAGFEQKMVALEGGTAAVATASGQAANLLALTNICRAGDHILAPATLYGGSYSLLHTTLPKFGIEATLFDPQASPRAIARLVRPNTRVLFGETIGNPGLNVLDFAKLSALARRFDLPFVVDNTLATPLLCNPLRHGANIVTHSATKYIDGHATSVGGIVIDGGNYDWNNGKFPDFTEPDPSYNGVSYTGQFPNSPFLIKARAQILRDFGACLNPHNAFFFNLGLETLHLRMERHGANALALARFLEKHPQVAWVNYPGLNPAGRRRIARHFNARNGSGVLTFGLRGGLPAIDRFVKRLRLAALVIHVGDARSSVLHPASSTHAQLDEEQQRSAGIAPEMIRVSVGIEDTADIVADFAQALATDPTP
ncbi:O-acetylhomoserine aminocarboxypropyltransferase/cysteine synthase family protein [Pseudothauera rhizosphaerae]|uniref:O-acetylhomoserine aminocarboxypropyltransferase/cysteine synthase n=1 Tax=Pseudothauera rhizosphaerae TaxID=2565932 RepID=A0A4S4AZV7_9RHOO|nr:O-acetylhomoserine aminocarboxypropyltransferase/cysteine synthase family protein [Pseudothauera rhizosphaerae]THF65289.1 O-acetylhomoserine aminocarboxypropyltransferase/cysteine synthase [Pseudothauera rhizosphaerae]